MRFVPANAQHVGARQNQQDSFGFSDLGDARLVGHGGFVAVVADGMGGLAHGDEASRLAVKTFLEAYGAKAETEPIPQALERALRSANAAVYELATRAGAPGDVGTTLVAVAVREEGLHWISVGDSAIYLQRGGALTLLTTSHVYARTLDARADRGEITADQARGDPQREALTSYVGSAELHEVDRNARPLPVRAGDAILLASDGLFKTLPEGEIAATLEADGERAPEALVRKTLACKKEHQDNVTVCLVRIEDDSAAPAPTPPPRAEAAPAATTWRPPDSDGPEPGMVSRARRLAFGLAALALFGAAAGFIGWMIAREPEPPRPDAAAPASGTEGRPPGEVKPGSVEPVLKVDPNAPAPPPRPAPPPDKDPAPRRAERAR